MASRVVIVDDEDDVRLLLRMQLEDAGFEIVGEAADGRAAVACCREQHPDAVVLDLLMPGVNGFEAAAVLRDEMPDIRVVAYTGVAGEFVRSEMARLGVRLVLKAGDAAALIAALSAAPPGKPPIPPAARG